VNAQHTGTPAAYIAWNFVQAASNSKRRDLLWFAIVGVTSHYLAERLSREAYDSYYAELRRDCEASRPGGEGEGESGGGGGLGFGRSSAPPGREGAIEECQQEPRFVMHRHWTLFESMRCSEYVSTRLNCWKADTPGVPSELRLLFAHCGTKPEVFEQPFTTVTKTDRVNFFSRLEDNVNADEFKYKMTTRELFYPSFTRTLGHGEPHMSAADYVHALDGLLCTACENSGGKGVEGGGGEGGGSGGGGRDEPPDESKSISWRDAWQAAYQALSRKRTDMLDTGLERAKNLRRAILRVVPQLVRSALMRRGEHIRWVDVGCDLTESERRLFVQPLALAELGRFIIRVYRDSLLMWRHKRTGALDAKPLLVYLRHKAKPQALYGSGADDGGWITVMALPVAEEGADAAFKVGFLRAAAHNLTHVLDSFSFMVLKIRAEHLLSFLRELDPHAEP
jgi:cell division control protein 45